MNSYKESHCDLPKFCSCSITLSTMKLSVLLSSTLVSFSWGVSLWQQILDNVPEYPLSITKQGSSSLEEHELISLHKSLVDIESVTGNEFEVGKFLEQYLSQKGFTVETQQVQPKRNNIYAYFGSKKNTKVLLTSHIDTVPPYFGYYNNDGDIYGRGSNDAKGSVATQIIAALELFKSREISHTGDVGLLFVVGEEVDGAGMRFASDHLDASWDHVIFGEPTELKLSIGHKGIYNFEVVVKGKAAHSGYPQLGIDANTKLIHLLNKIVHAELPSDKLLGNSTINPGIIEAGVAANVVSPIAKAKILIRAAHDAARVKKIISRVVQKENQEYHNIELTDIQLEEPVYLDHEVPGFDTAVMAYFTDVPNLRRRVQTRYLYGPGSILNAHTSYEHVSLEDLKKAVSGYKKLVKYLLSK